MKETIKFILIILFILIYADPVMSTGKQKKKIKPWDLNFSLSTYYDNNILKFSDKYLERFRSNQDEGRFHINHYDDVVLDYDLKLSYRHRFIRNLNSILYASAGHNSYSYNSVKTWSSLSFGVQQFVASGSSIMLSYTHIPDYYIKHYRDDDWVSLLGYRPETFKPFSFSKNDMSVWGQHNLFSSTRARVYFSYMKYYHNQHFTEYDSENLLYGIRLFQTISKNISADIGYRYITSDAKGYDQEGESKLSSDDSDASYNENVMLAGITFQLPRFLKVKNSLSVSGQYSHRNYTSQKDGMIDPIHAGRVDDFINFNINYSISLLNNLSLTAFFNWINRDSETNISANKELLSLEKDYSQNMLGFSFNYQFKF